MMTNVQLFDFEGYEVRIVGTSENPEWIARDVAEVLGITQSTLSRRLKKIPTFIDRRCRSSFRISTNCELQ